MLYGPYYILVEIWNLLTPWSCSTCSGDLRGHGGRHGCPASRPPWALPLLTGLTFRHGSEVPIIILLCVYVGAITGGSRSSILLNIPGTPANAAAALDGFPLAQRGEAGPAIGLSATSSFLARVFGIMCLAFLTPLLGQLALKFILGVFSGWASSGRSLRQSHRSYRPPERLDRGFPGLLLSLVGRRASPPIPCFAFGFDPMRGGFSLIPVLVGAYGLAEVFAVMREKTHIKIPKQVGSHPAEVRSTSPRTGDHAALRGHRVIIGIIAGWARTWPPGSPMISPSGLAKPRAVRQGIQEGADGSRNPAITPASAEPSSRCSRWRSRAARRAAVLLGAMWLHGHPARPAAHGGVSQLHLGDHGHADPGRLRLAPDQPARRALPDQDPDGSAAAAPCPSSSPCA